MDDRRVDVDELCSYIWVEGVNKSLTPGITNRRLHPAPTHSDASRPTDGFELSEQLGASLNDDCPAIARRAVDDEIRPHTSSPTKILPARRPLKVSSGGTA